MSLVLIRRSQSVALATARRPVAGADLEGNLYVADTDNQRIQKLSASGEPIDQWGHYSDGEEGACSRFSIGDQAGEFAQPRAVVVNGRDEVIVADHFNHRVQVLKAIPVWFRPTPPGE